jgi:hypothetical protein
LVIQPPASAAAATVDDGDEISILMSDALGTHLVGMLNVVNDLVLQMLNNVLV